MAKHRRKSSKPRARTVTRTKRRKTLKSGAKQVCKCRTVKRGR